MKYGFRPRAIPRVKTIFSPRDPSGLPLGENHISWYVLTRVNVLLQYRCILVFNQLLFNPGVSFYLNIYWSIKEFPTT